MYSVYSEALYQPSTLPSPRGADLDEVTAEGEDGVHPQGGEAQLQGGNQVLLQVRVQGGHLQSNVYTFIILPRIDPRSDPFLLVNINMYSEFMLDLFRVDFTDECDSLEVLEAEVGELE